MGGGISGFDGMGFEAFVAEEEERADQTVDESSVANNLTI